MCGRFFVDEDTLREITKIIQNIDTRLAKTGEIYPSDPALVLYADEKKISAKVMEWGYDSFSGGKKLINARSETVTQRTMFSADYKSRRCVIPADLFYEWKNISSRNKEKFSFYIPDNILYLAGIYHLSSQGAKFTILTKAASGCMEGIHSRMPVIIQSSDIDKWLFSQADAYGLMNKECDSLQRNNQNGYEQISLFH